MNPFPKSLPSETDTIPSPDALNTSSSILVVDDEISIRELVSEALSDAGYKVHTAESADDALEKLQASHYDLLLTDYHMPKKSAEDLFLQMRSLGLAIPTILMTGRAKELILRYHELPVDAVLSKPFTIDELFGLVAYVLRSASPVLHV